MSELPTPPKKSSLTKLSLALSLCMMLGSAGSCRGIAELATWDEPITVPLPALRLPEEADPEWKELAGAWSELKEAQTETYRARRPAMSALAVVNLASSLVLLFGALATAGRFRRGLSALQSGLALSQAYVFLGIAVGTWVQLGLAETAQSVLGPLRQLDHAVAMKATELVGAFWFTIPVTVIGLLIQFLFYLWVSGLLKKPEIQTALTPRPE